MESYSLLVSDVKSDIFVDFDTPWILSPDKEYELALVSLDTYNSLANVDPTNNKFVYNNGPTRKEIQIPEGAYELDDLNSYINNQLRVNGEPDDVIQLLANTNTLKCILKISNPKYSVSFKEEGTLRDLLGFDSKVYTKSQEGERNVNILKVNTILVHCDVVGGSVVNGQSHPTIYSFFPNVSPGFKIVESPYNLIYLPVTTRTIRSIRVWLTSQNPEEILNLRGETITVRLHLKSK